MSRTGRQTTPSHEQIAALIVRTVCELPGYSSPDDQPDLIMCTVQELEDAVLRALDSPSSARAIPVKVPR
jgi:hypothetical protein